MSNESVENEQVELTEEQIAEITANKYMDIFIGNLARAQALAISSGHVTQATKEETLQVLNYIGSILTNSLTGAMMATQEIREKSKIVTPKKPKLEIIS